MARRAAHATPGFGRLVAGCAPRKILFQDTSDSKLEREILVNYRNLPQVHESQRMSGEDNEKGP